MNYNFRALSFFLIKSLFLVQLCCMFQHSLHPSDVLVFLVADIYPLGLPVPFAALDGAFEMQLRHVASNCNHFALGL